MYKISIVFKGLRSFLLLWATQAFSTLGSSMTSYALIIWSYEQKGSALMTALLAVCSYAPYVILSIFAGAMSDRWNRKKILLFCDSAAAASTLTILFLLHTGALQIWHLYLLNALNGFMNTIQQPASDVMTSLLAPKEQYQRVGGMQSFSNSLVTILTPVIATAFLMLAGIRAVLLFDLVTFGVAVITLAFFIRIPEVSISEAKTQRKESLLKAAGEGLGYLKKNRGILTLILFLAAINLIASIYNAALPAMLLSREGGGREALGWVNTCTGVATILGSVWATFSKPPKSRVRVICNALFFSMSTENFFLAFGRSTPVWCVGALLGWIAVPIMNTNMSTLLRTYIPIEMQGRVYSARNTLQFFTIPGAIFWAAFSWIMYLKFTWQSRGQEAF